MKKKDIFAYISIILILVIFIIIYMYSCNSIELFEDNPILEKRVSDLEKKYGELIPNATKTIGDRLTKYDNMYVWYENALATQTTAAQQASAEAQAKLKESLNKSGGNADPNVVTGITDSLSKGAEKTADKDNISSVNKSIEKESPPNIKPSSSTDAMLSLF
jgi:hypothetical protein